MYKTETNSDTENRLAVTCGGGMGGKHWELGVSRYQLLHIGWINNKVLLYSTGYSI